MCMNKIENVLFIVRFLVRLFEIFDDNNYVHFTFTCMFSLSDKLKTIR